MTDSKMIGVIGGGNMGGGIISGIVSSGLVKTDHLIASDVNLDSLNYLKERYGIKTTSNNKELCKSVDIIFLVVKPALLATVVPEIRDYIREDTLVISVAAGRPIAYVESLFERPIRLIRIMPNLGAVVGESMTGYTPNLLADEQNILDAEELFACFGRYELIPENLMDVVVAVGGSAPAYICTMLDAMADAAVLNGMPRRKAYTFVAQSMLGTAKYLLEMQTTPSILKDNVCTPGGTSIAAVSEMERLGARYAIMSAVNAAAEKSKEMSDAVLKTIEPKKN